MPYSGDVGAEPISTQMEEGFTFWHGVVDLTCKKSNPGWEWLCYISPYAYPHISTPIFIQTEQYDTYQGSSFILLIYYYFFFYIFFYYFHLFINSFLIINIYLIYFYFYFYFYLF